MRPDFFLLVVFIIQFQVVVVEQWRCEVSSCPPLFLITTSSHTRHADIIPRTSHSLAHA